MFHVEHHQSGRFAGRPLLSRWEPVRRRTEPQIERAERLFAERGGPTILGARFVGALRAIAPLVAGIERMRFRTFLVWNVVASIAWATLTVSLGYFVGERIASVVDRAGWVISAVVLVVVGGWWVLRRRRRR